MAHPSAAAHHGAPHSAGSAHHGHHIVPQKTLFIVFGVLLFLTALTVVTATQLDLGAFNVPLALAIAATKAGLVVTIFMALKWDSPVNRLAAVMGILFVTIFLTFTLFDTLFRGDVGNVDPQTIKDIEIQEKALQAREPQGDLTGQPDAGEPSDNPGAATVPLTGPGQDSPAGAAPAPQLPSDAPAQ